MNLFRSKRVSDKLLNPKKFNEVSKTIFSKDNLSYEKLIKIREKLLDTWQDIKDDEQYKRKWHNTFDELIQLFNIKMHEAFNTGNISWHQAGGFSGSFKTILVEDINIMEHTKDWEIVKSLPHGNNAPYYNGRPVTMYKLSTHKTIYFGFTEVSNGCYCCWSRAIN